MDSTTHMNEANPYNPQCRLTRIASAKSRITPASGAKLCSFACVSTGTSTLDTILPMTGPQILHCRLVGYKIGKRGYVIYSKTFGGCFLSGLSGWSNAIRTTLRV